MNLPITTLTRNPIFGKNRLKLGLFCANTINALTLAPEMLLPSWSNCLRVAQIADQAGFEAITPIARWKGYLDGQPDHPSNEVMEAFTYAAAIAQATTHAAIFATTHAPTMHPIAVAKQAATIDHISNGRFVLNVVGGWNRREFAMFGIDLLPHDERYMYLAEWLDVLRKLWTGDEFDLVSKYFNMHGAVCRPRPVQPGGITIMNAATSPMGMRFAAAHSDIAFCMPQGDDPTGWAAEVHAYKEMARTEFGREIQVWTTAAIVQRETREEAMAYRHRFAKELLDVPALDGMVNTLRVENGWAEDDPRIALMRERLPSGTGFPVIGNAPAIAGQLQAMAGAGINGVLLTWVDYIDGISRFIAEVLPLLEQVGLREAFVGAST